MIHYSHIDAAARKTKRKNVFEHARTRKTFRRTVATRHTFDFGVTVSMGLCYLLGVTD